MSFASACGSVQPCTQASDAGLASPPGSTEDSTAASDFEVSCGPMRLPSFVLWGALMAQSAVAAEPPRYRLLLEVPAEVEGCPSSEVIAGAVSARLGYSPWDPSARRVLRVHLERRRGWIEGRLQIEEPAGSAPLGVRRLEPLTSCAQLTEGASFAIAIAIDPLGVPPRNADPDTKVEPPPTREPAPTPTESSTRAAALSSPAPAPSPAPPPPTSAPGRPFGLVAEIGLLLSLDSAPAVAPGLSLGAAIGAGRLSVGLEGRFDLPASAALSGGGRVESALFLGTIAPCIRLLDHWQACALVSAGALRVAGLGLVGARNGTAAYAAAGGRLAVRWPFDSGLGVALAIEGRAVLTRISLVDLDGMTTYWTTPLAQGSVVLSAFYEIL